MAEPPSSTSTTTGTSLIKSLAACNASTRSKALKSLITWLQHQPQPPLSDDDFKKLWKGLFYCVWHSDKPTHQSNLIDRLSSLLLTLPPPLSLNYFSHFLLTLRREWPSIDTLRLDKFCLMIRFFIRRLFELMSEKRWDLGVLGDYWRVLEETLFCSEQGDGVCYHVVSVFCDEIRRFLPLELGVLEAVFRPFVGVLGRAADRVLLGKVEGDLFGCLVRCGRGLMAARESGEVVDEGEDERVLFGGVVVGMGFSARFYEVGSSSDCVQGNRKLLFGLHEEFDKLEKDLRSSGVDFKLPEANGDDKNVDDESTDKLSKKKKDKGASKDMKRRKKNNKNADVPVETTNDNEKVTNVEGDNVADKNVDDESLPKKKSASKAKQDKKRRKKNNENVDEPDSPKINSATLSNLQMQFEEVAAEDGLDEGVSSSLEASTCQGNVDTSKKRKRGKNGDNGIVSVGSDVVGDENVEGDINARSAEKSGKKVNFSMGDNLVWNPCNPLPPHSLRIPPSSTPRGSALKKGVPAGPVSEMSPETKMVKKKASPSRKKVVNSKSSAGKRTKKRKSSA